MNDRHLLGYSPMDAIHAEFLQCTQALLQASELDMVGALTALVNHLFAHFEMENRWMIDTDFPARQCHVAEHDAVLKSAEQVKLAAMAGNYAQCHELAEKLLAWFPGHADYLDSALAHWMCKIKFDAKPLVFKRQPVSDVS